MLFNEEAEPIFFVGESDVSLVLAMLSKEEPDEGETPDDLKGVDSSLGDVNGGGGVVVGSRLVCDGG